MHEAEGEGSAESKEAAGEIFGSRTAQKTGLFVSSEVALYSLVVK